MLELFQFSQNANKSLNEYPISMRTETTEQNGFYRTSDLALATVISLSHQIEAVDRKNPRRADFLFQRNERLDEIIEKYWDGKLKIEPQAFFNQLRIIKSRLYGE